ncbi:hypothetical protein CT171_09340 [Trueperella pyogenes]|uniref:tetratricopeptide repeat protein n=1 Tax=Trueperella pyogenes TaxID=1661 RepID=UPI000C1B7209|nr:tetratricopeptide repeat protein [Trueperella pyogenes]PIN50917.1 hypothetical protein CT171_09340 [Trueperella pyogenes]
MKKIVVAVAGLLALALASVAVLSGVVLYGLSVGKNRYDAGSFPGSARAYDVAWRAMPGFPGRWEAYFGAGTARLQAGQTDAGIDQLSVALTLVPAGTQPDGQEYSAECTVRINLAIGLMTSGDAQTDKGAAAATFARARKVAEPCNHHELAKQIQEQAGKKQEEAEREQAAGQSDSGDKDARKDSDEQSGEKQHLGDDSADKNRKLLERMRQAERQHRAYEEYDKSVGSKNGENW